MRVEKYVCDVCKKDIEEDHPLRLSVETYQHTGERYGNAIHAYRSVAKFHICKDCINKLPKEMVKVLENV